MSLGLARNLSTTMTTTNLSRDSADGEDVVNPPEEHIDWMLELSDRRKLTNADFCIAMCWLGEAGRSATRRWGQRLVNSVAAQYGWPLFTADASQALLRGLTFAQAAQMKDEVQRGAQVNVAPGNLQILQRLPGFEDFNPLVEAPP